MKREFYALFAILLGCIGAHFFYDRKNTFGILSILFCWSGIPSIIGIVCGLIALTENDEYFRFKHSTNKILLNG